MLLTQSLHSPTVCIILASFIHSLQKETTMLKRPDHTTSAAANVASSSGYDPYNSASRPSLGASSDVIDMPRSEYQANRLLAGCEGGRTAFRQTVDANHERAQLLRMFTLRQRAWVDVDVQS